MYRDKLTNLKQKRFENFCTLMKHRGYSSPEEIKRLQTFLVMSALTNLAALVIAYLIALMLMPGYAVLAKTMLIVLSLWLLVSKGISYRWAQAFKENSYVE